MVRQRADGLQVFEALDLVLAGLAVAGMVAALRPDALAPWAGAAVPGAAVLIVFVQLVNDPPAAVGSDPSAGAWIALAGAMLMAAGAALSLAAISVTVQVRERDVRRRVSAVDRRHATEEELAEDLDADADEGARPSRSASLFGGLVGARDDAESDDVLGEEPPKRTGRFAQRDQPDDEAAAITSAAGSASHPAPGGATAGGGAPTPAGGDDLERTQPFERLPDDEGDAGRS